MIELAGPERIPLDELVGQFFAATGDTRTIVTDDSAPYFGTLLNDQSLTASAGAHLGPTRFQDWLSRTAVKK